MKLFKTPSLIEPPSPNPLEAALADVSHALDEALREAAASAARVEELRERRRLAAAGLDVERTRLREEELRKTVLERVQPLVDEVTQLDGGIAEALTWLRAAIERREQLADRAERLATGNLCRPHHPDVPKAPRLEFPELRATGERCRETEVTFKYSLGPIPSLD